MALPQAYIFHNDVRHARFLPVESAHAFSYSTLAVFVSISALESQKLDLYGGRLFGYSPAGSGSTWCRILGIRPEHYLHGYTPNEEGGEEKRMSIREKLEDVLERFGYDSRLLEDAWMQTMPRYMGIGFNPLTVYYCYRKDDPRLWVIVLEVHNAHEERHVYALEAGAGHEDPYVPPRYDHAWTFPRQFHVSPFNDRSGFYSCSIVEPPHPPFNISSLQFTSLDKIDPKFLPAIRIQMYTPGLPDSSESSLPLSSDTEGLSKQLKLTATFRPTSAKPLTPQSVLRAISLEPFTLALTFIRIGHQAILLHYKRRLDTYVRPEPRAIDEKLESLFEEDVIGMNRVQRRQGYKLGIGGGIKWQEEGLCERYARRVVERFINFRSYELGVRVNIHSTNPTDRIQSFPILTKPDLDSKGVKSKSIGTEPDLNIMYRTPNAFLLMLLAPSPELALLLGRDAEHTLFVSDDELFVKLFTVEKTKPTPATFIQRFLQYVRCAPIPEALLSSSIPQPGESGSTLEYQIPHVHPLDLHLRSPSLYTSDINDTDTNTHNQMLNNITTLLVITLQISLTILEKWWSTFSGTRFVPGGDPWGAWDRAISSYSNSSSRADKSKNAIRDRDSVNTKDCCAQVRDDSHGELHVEKFSSSLSSSPSLSGVSSSSVSAVAGADVAPEFSAKYCMSPDLREADPELVRGRSAQWQWTGSTYRPYPA
ncbi:hypothetical protein PNOK_0863500 [Pyrrhoderma noxium]|uniref:Uncharacterized protein n=1 Tax=Pyrrhoderma noxium TaxID=2282107 RepID=A0A286U843_9AGAM|nr:hypothetical protein PNOK_0863500 [Pyrrhoderma noxium]